MFPPAPYKKKMKKAEIITPFLKKGLKTKQGVEEGRQPLLEKNNPLSGERGPGVRDR
jgi:hypothetical protein